LNYACIRSTTVLAPLSCPLAESDDVILGYDVFATFSCRNKTRAKQEEREQKEGVEAAASDDSKLQPEIEASRKQSSKPAAWPSHDWAFTSIEIALSSQLNRRNVLLESASKQWQRRQRSDGRCNRYRRFDPAPDDERRRQRHRRGIHSTAAPGLVLERRNVVQKHQKGFGRCVSFAARKICRPRISINDRCSRLSLLSVFLLRFLSYPPPSTPPLSVQTIRRTTRCSRRLIPLR